MEAEKLEYAEANAAFKHFASRHHQNVSSNRLHMTEGKSITCLPS